VVGVLLFCFILVGHSQPQHEETTYRIPEQSLFVKSQLSKNVPPPLRIVGDSVLEGNRVPNPVEPETLASVDTEPDREELIKYKVKKGDNLTKIANKFDLSVETLLWANDLSQNSTINPGQNLIILPVDGVLYSVRSGDTLSSIAQTYKTEIEKVVDYNNLQNESDIYAGDLLILPEAEMPQSVPAAVHTPLAESYFIYPCQGTISQEAHGYLNNAVDIAKGCGSPVVAAAGGTVRRAGTIRIGGNRVTVLHPNGAITYYGHLSTIAVSPGQEVNAGDIIGYIGNTGYTLGPTGCHLHFAVRGANNFLKKYSTGAKLSW